jgi:hypothetical protein
VSNRTRSKADYTDQHIGSRTRSKMHKINNLSVKNLFFPLHDAIIFEGHGNSQAQYFQLGVVECKVYHNVLLNTKSQIDLNHLLQMHMLDQTEEGKAIFWEYYKVGNHCKGERYEMITDHKFLVECSDTNETKSWVNYFALNILILNLSFHLQGTITF